MKFDIHFEFFEVNFFLRVSETFGKNRFPRIPLDALRFVGKEIEWSGSGDNEVGREKGTDVVRVKVNPKYYRPTEVEQLMGDSTKAREEEDLIQLEFFSIILELQ